MSNIEDTLDIINSILEDVGDTEPDTVPISDTRAHDIKSSPRNKKVDRIGATPVRPILNVHPDALAPQEKWINPEKGQAILSMKPDVPKDLDDPQFELLTAIKKMKALLPQEEEPKVRAPDSPEELKYKQSADYLHALAPEDLENFLGNLHKQPEDVRRHWGGGMTQRHYLSPGMRNRVYDAAYPSPNYDRKSAFMQFNKKLQGK